MEHNHPTTRARTPTTVQVDDTLIIGAGPAGLAVGACLQRAGVPFLIIEQSDRVGASWHRHYHRLHLHTSKGHSSLPFLPLPKHYPRYPSRQQVIDYLEGYAQVFNLAPRFGQKVLEVRQGEEGWEVLTQDTRYQTQRVVIATGFSRVPHVPVWPGQEDYQGTILHSSRYTSGEAFKHQRVLVVGFGNSGGELALDLWEHGVPPRMAVRSPVNVIPRDLFGIPVLTFGIWQSMLPPRLADIMNAPLQRIVMGDLARYGLHAPPFGPVTQIHAKARIPLIDVGTIKLIKQGHIQVHPGIDHFIKKGVVFTDGTKQHFDVVILATGYRPKVNDFFRAGVPDCDEVGTPKCSGCEASRPGVYFCGFYVSPTGMLREIAIEAKRIGVDVVQKRKAIGSEAVSAI